jgi:hypothetical protein
MSAGGEIVWVRLQRSAVPFPSGAHKTIYSQRQFCYTSCHR